MSKYVVLAGGLGNQLFQIAGALSATDEVVHAIACLGNPKEHAGELEVSILDFHGRVQFTKCYKRHYLSQLAFRAMLSLATTRRDLLDKSPSRKMLLLIAAAIFSVHFRTAVYPRISKGVGFDPEFRESKGNLFIGYFQTHRISDSVKELMINALNQMEPKTFEPQAKSSEALIHIRLGDYKVEPTIGMLKSDYFSTVLNLLEMQEPIKKISIFSDESQNALKLIPLSFSDRVNVEEQAGESPLLTLCRMRGYENYVLANSTFSWWAAYTSTPQKVFVPDPWFATGVSPSELIPESWIRIKRD
jgi:hypothetical protein